MNSFVKSLETQLGQFVILSTVYWISQCVASDKKFDIPGKEDDFVHIYTLTPYIHTKEYGSKAKIWIILLGILGGIVIVLTCIFCYFALERRSIFRRSPASNPLVAAAFHPPPSAPALEDSSTQGLPDYTSVTLGVYRLSVPEEQPQQKLETPPPEYITVAPFK